VEIKILKKKERKRIKQQIQEELLVKMV